MSKKIHPKALLLMRLAAVVVTLTSIYIFAPWEYGLYYLSPQSDTIDEEIDDAVASGVDGIIVYTQKGEAAPNYYAAGWHNRAAKIPADPKALFKIGSIRKLYDAAAVAKLAARGKLSLDKKLADYLPEITKDIEYADQITLRMMVQHKSGIPNYTDHKDFQWSGPPLSSEEVIMMISDGPALFKPNTDYSYSNSNYYLLRKIMSKVLGYDHEQFIADEIWAPLGLSRSYYTVTKAPLNEVMSGYYVGYEDDLKTLDQGHVASAGDVGVFIRALNDGSLFTDKEREIYATLYKFDHDGWVLGYRSIASYHPDIDTVIVQFVNTTGNDIVMLTDIIHNRIAEIVRKNTN